MHFHKVYLVGLVFGAMASQITWADPDETDALVEAHAEEGTPETEDEFIARGFHLAQTDPDGFTFWLTTDEGSQYIEERDEFRRTLLHVATEAGRHSTILLLLEEGANIDAIDVNGFFPINYYRGRSPILRLRLQPTIPAPTQWQVPPTPPPTSVHNEASMETDTPRDDAAFTAEVTKQLLGHINPETFIVLFLLAALFSIDSSSEVYWVM